MDKFYTIDPHMHIVEEHKKSLKDIYITKTVMQILEKINLKDNMNRQIKRFNSIINNSKRLQIMKHEIEEELIFIGYDYLVDI